MATATKSKADGPAFFDQPLPSDTDAEDALIGSVLLDPNVLDEFATTVAYDDFLNEPHRSIWRVIREKYDAGKKIDVVLLAGWLKDCNAVDNAPAILAKLARAVPHAAHAVYYANRVVEKSVKRKVIEATTLTCRDAYEPSTFAQQVVNDGEQRLHSILDRQSATVVEDIKEILHRALDRADLRAEGKFESGTPTGFDELDAMTGGFHPSQLIVLAARPGLGKTALAMNIAENVAVKAGRSVLFASLEMSADELGDRMLSSVSRINGHKFRAGSLTPHERQSMKTATAAIFQSPFYADAAPTQSVAHISSAARKIRRQTKRDLGLIVVDYLQLVDPDDHKIPRQEQVARMTRRLKLLAKEMACPVLCLAQLNRQIEQGNDHRPKLSHLRESGAIEQDADVVMFIHRDDYYTETTDNLGKAEIIIAKQRSGPTGTANVVWKREFTRFENPRSEFADAFEAYNSRPSDEPTVGGSWTGGIPDDEDDGRSEF